MRSKWKSLIIDLNLHKELKGKFQIGVLPKPNNWKQIHRVYTKQRQIQIISKWIGNKIRIYNGKIFIERELTNILIGIKLGELSLSKKPAKYKIHNEK